MGRERQRQRECEHTFLPKINLAPHQQKEKKCLTWYRPCACWDTSSNLLRPGRRDTERTERPPPGSARSARLLHGRPHVRISLLTNRDAGCVTAQGYFHFWHLNLPARHTL